MRRTAFPERGRRAETRQPVRADERKDVRELRPQRFYETEELDAAEPRRDYETR